MKDEPAYLLLADDDPDDRDFFCAAMQRLYPQVIIHAFEDGDHLLAYLQSCELTLDSFCIVLDYKMPRLTAPQFLIATGSGTRYAQIPKIVWSSSHRVKDMEDCIGLGAVSYLIKPPTDAQLEEVLRSLERWIAVKSFNK